MIERLGIFGGTFDPPHIGHQILATEALSQLFLDKVFWVLTPDPPHKQGRQITPLETRLDMVKAAIAESSDFELSRIEIDRPAPHYAVDTLRLLVEQYPHAEIVYLMGGDSLSDLPDWYNANEFVAACHTIGVMRRSGFEIDLRWLENQIPGIKLKIKYMETPSLEIAASLIRSKVQSGESFRNYLHPSVYRIIQEHNLYQA